MKKAVNILLLAMMVFGLSVSVQAIDLTVGSGDYYVSVGDYDYLPYAYNASPGYQSSGLSFQTMMGDYGSWTHMQPFGQVWRPYVDQEWRPYTQGHWNYTQYGPTWQGYEPWAWAGYHYGNWVFSQQQGWVWIPGYEWHPGRVAWSQGYNSIGWMPMPPAGYDYSRGYLANVGPQNQFTYNDDDFSVGFSFGGGDNYYGGPYYDQRYRNSYYNPAYLNLAGALWSFIDPNHFGNDNYADYYYGGDYTRQLFDGRLVRISSRPIERVVLERLVRQPIQVRQVRTNEVQIDGRRVRIAAVDGEQEKIRKNANRVVREVIAPAFAQKGKAFKAEKARNRNKLEQALKLENTPRRVETVSTEQLVREAKQGHQKREVQRTQIREQKRQEVVQIEKQGKVKEKKDKGLKQTENEVNRSRSTKVNPETPRDRNVEKDQDQNQNEKRNRPVENQDQDLKQNRPPDEPKDNQKRNRPVDEQKDTDKIKRNTPPEQNQDEDMRLKDREKQPKVTPESDENIQRDTDRESKEESDVQKDDDTKKNAESNASKKAKNKKTKTKDKDKKPNQDEPPQN